MEYSKQLQMAIDHLENHSICVSDGDHIYTNDRNGVSPMMYFIYEKLDLTGYSLADAFVGKAAAMLFDYAGIKEVYTKLISEPALQYLQNHHIPVYYDQLVEHILNRKGDGMCIMEAATLNCDDPKEAYQIVKNKLISMYGREFE